MPVKDVDGGLVWAGYFPAVVSVKGAKALPKDTYSSVPFGFGGSQVKTALRKFRTTKR